MFIHSESHTHMPFDEFFDRVVVINLRHRHDRRARLEEHLGAIGKISNIEWFAAYAGDVLSPPGWWNSGQGAWGCLLSHSTAVAGALRDDVTTMLVLEDDVVFQPDFASLLGGFMKQVPDDWGQIYLGGQHLKEPELLKDRPFVLRAKNVNRTHAYAIHRRAMADFHRHIWEAASYMVHPEGWHVDHQLGLAHEQGLWPVYAPAIWIAGQGEDWSSIRPGLEIPRCWWHPSKWKGSLPFIWIDSKLADMPMRDRAWLHGGNNLKEGTVEDIGLDVAALSDDRLASWLQLIAQEALDHEKLPALQHPFISLQRLEKNWPGPVRVWTEGGAEKIHSAIYGVFHQRALSMAAGGGIT